jgi:hypothetical protein
LRQKVNFHVTWSFHQIGFDIKLAGFKYITPNLAAAAKAEAALWSNSPKPD